MNTENYCYGSNSISNVFSSSIENVGGEEEIYITGSSNPIQFRTLRGQNNIDVNQDVGGEIIDIDLDIANASILGNPLIATDQPGLVEVKTIVPGSNVSIIDTGNEIIINAGGTGSGLNNVGTDGENIFTGSNNDMRSIVGLNNIDIGLSVGTTEVEVDLDIRDGGVDGSHLSLIATDQPGLVETKGLVPGSNITFMDSGTDIMISSDPLTLSSVGVGPVEIWNGTGGEIKTMQGAGNIEISSSPTITVNLDINSAGMLPGTNSLIANDMVGLVQTKGLVAGNDITLNDSGCDITINSTGQSTLTNAGGQVPVFDGTSTMYTLQGLNNVNITPNGNIVEVDLDINSSGTGDESLIQTDGSGQVTLKQLTAGTNISLTNNGGDIEIESTQLNVINAIGATPGSTSLIDPDVVTPGTTYLKTIQGVGNVQVSSSPTISVTLDIADSGTGDESIIKTDSSGLVELKRITGGTNINASSNSDEIVLDLDLPSSGGSGQDIISGGEIRTIEGLNNILVGLDVPMNTVQVDLDISSTGGGDEFIIKQSSPGIVVLKDLSAGTGITLTTPDTDQIVINSTGQTPLTNIGGQEEIFDNTNGIRTLRGLDNVNVNQVGSIIDIGLNINTTNTGEESLIELDTSGTVTLRELTAGNNITLLESGGAITISSIAQSGLTNIGGQEEIFDGLAGIRTLRGLNNIDVNQAGSIIDINLDITATGSGISPIENDSQGLVNLKTFSAGTNVTLDNTTPTNIVINSSQLALQNIGGQVEVFDDSTTTNIRTLRGLNDVRVAQNGDVIEIDLEALNVGAGTPILVDPPTSGLGHIEAKSLVAGSNVSIVDNGNDITINAGGGGAMLTNVGTVGENVFTGSGGEMRSIVGLNNVNVDLSGATTEIEIDLNIGNAAGIVGETLIETDTSGSVLLKGVVGLNNVAVGTSVSGDDIEIDLDITSSGVGTNSLINSQASGSVDFKTLTPGSNITFTDAGGNITINSAGTGPMLANIGTGETVYSGTAGDFKTILGLNNVNVDTSLSGNEVEIDLDIRSTGVGDEDIIFLEDSGNAVFKQLTAGTNIGLTSDNDQITINATQLTLTNEGTVAAQDIHTGTAGELRGILGINNILTSTNGNDIEVDLNITSTGLGINMLENDTPGTVNIKTISAGSNISLDNTTPTNIVINSTGQSTLTNIGGQEEIFDGTTGIRTLRGLNNVNVNQLGPIIDIDLDVSNTGIGDEVLISNDTPGSVTIKRLTAGSNIGLSSDANQITISSTQLALSNVGVTGEDIWTTTNGDLKGINATGIIDTSNTPTDININLDANDVSTGDPILGPSTGVGQIDIKGITTSGVIGSTNSATDIDIGLTIQDAALATGISVINSTTTGDVRLRTITGANNVEVTNVGDDIQVDLNISSTNTGEESLISTDASGSVVLRELVAGNNITLIDNGLDIEIASTQLSLSNAGGGDAEVWNGSQLRTISGLNNVNVSENGDVIEVDLDVRSTLVGDEDLIVLDNSGNAVFKRLTGGTNVNLSSDANQVTINAIPLTNVGLGSPIHTGTDAELRSIVGLNNVNVAVSGGGTGDEIEVNLDISDAGVVPGHSSLLAADMSGIVTTKGLVGGTNVTLIDSGTDITINSSQLALQNIGGQIEIFDDSTTTNIRTIRGLNNVNVDLDITGNIVDVDLDISDSGVGNESLIRDDLSGSVVLRRITGGVNVDVTTNSTADQIVINAPQLALQNIGGQIEIFDDSTTTDIRTVRGLNNVNVDLDITGNIVDVDLDVSTSTTGDETLIQTDVSGLVVLKELTAGTGISLTNNGGDIEIGSTGLITLNNVGTILAQDVWTGVGGNLRGIRVNGNLITLTGDSNDIILSSSASNIGTGSIDILSPSPGNVLVRGLIAGGLIRIIQTATDILITLDVDNAPGFSGESIIDPFTSVGDLRLRGILGTGNINASINGSTIELNLDIIDSNVGDETLISNEDPNGDVTFKRLTGGTGITLTSDSDQININSDLTLNNVGVGAEIWTTSGGDLRSITGGGIISVTETGSEIDIDLAVSTTGTGDETILNSFSPGSFSLKELTAGTDISLVDNGGDIQINATGSRLTCGANNVITGPASVLLAVNTINAMDASGGLVTVTFPVGSDGDTIILKDMSGVPLLSSNVVINATGQLIEDPSNPTVPYTSFTTTANFVGGIPKEGYVWKYCANVSTGTWMCTQDYEPPTGSIGSPFSQCYRFIVENGITVNKDTAVSILQNGNVVQGYGEPGKTNITDLDNVQITRMIDRGNNKYLIAEISTGNLQIVIDNPANNRPTFGPLFNATILGGGIGEIVSLDATHFAVISDDGNVTTSTRIYSVAAGLGTTITAEGASFTNTLPSSLRDYSGVSLNSGAEFVYINTNDNSGFTQIDARHYSRVGLVLTPTTAIQTNVVTSTLVLPGIAEFVDTIPPFELTSTDALVILTRLQSTIMYVLRWTAGPNTFSAGNEVNPTWTPATGRTTGSTFIASTVFALSGGTNRYSTYSVSGTTIIGQTLDAPTPIVGANPVIDAIGTNIIVTGRSGAVHGKIAGGAPFAITWGTPIVLDEFVISGIMYTSSTTASIITTAELIVSVSVVQASDTLTLYEFDGQEPIGLAKSTVIGNGVLTVDITALGEHTTTGLLTRGRQYLINSDGVISLLSTDGTTLNSGRSRIIGPAVETNKVLLTWQGRD